LKKEKEAKEKELNEAKEAIAAKLADLRTRFGLLEGEKQEALGKAREATERATAAEGAVATLRTDLTARDTTIGELQADIRRLQEELDRRPPGPAVDPEALRIAQEEAAQLRVRVADLETLEAQLAAMRLDRDNIKARYDALFAIDPGLTPDLLNQYRTQAARVQGLEGDLLDEGVRADTAERAKERAEAAEIALQQANARLQAALDARTPEEEVAALLVSVNAAQANVQRLNDELREEQAASAGLRSKLAKFNDLLTAINTTLGSNGLPQVPEDLNEEAINRTISALQEKLNAPPPPAPPAGPDNRVSICLLNIVYHLLKRIHISKGDAADTDYRPGFQAVEEIAASPSITDSTIRQFLVCLKAWDNTLSEEEQTYYASQEYIDELNTLNGLIPEDEREAVINLGKSIFAILYPGLGMDEIDVNLILPVIGILAFTKKILLQNQDIITAAGCVIPGGLGTIPAAAAVAAASSGSSGPGGRDPGGREPGGRGPGGGNGEGGEDGKQGDGDEDANNNVEPAPRVNRAGVAYGGKCDKLTEVDGGDQTVNIPLANKLRKIPFCLDVLEATPTKPFRYSGKDILMKASQNLLQNLKSKGILPGTPEFSAEIRKVTLALELGTTMYINPTTGDVSIGRLNGGSTRKLRRNTNVKSKTYKQRK
jgi:hypothetical protein